jgi:hypothetical protein
LRLFLIRATVGSLLIAASASAQIDPSILRPVGYHASEVAYFNTPYLGNSLAHGGEWRQFSTSEFGTDFDYSAPENAGQFINGYPQFLGNGTTTGRGPNLRALLFGVNINNTDIRPAGWPLHDAMAKGRYVVTWQGNADIRLQSGTFLAGESTVAETGSFANGHRVYLCSSIPQTLEIRQIVTPITDLEVWLPGVDDPATPANESQTTSLENQFFHPLLLRRIADASWSFVRFMDWGKTNASPQQDWVDRRLPNHIFQAGVINSRQPSATAEGHRETGVSWEHMVALANATGRDLWINVPHLATDDYITRLARLIRFGSDGVNPYSAPEASPVFPPLNPALKVYVEFSNEIWSSGFSFPQGNWAEEQAALTSGLGTGTANKARFTARKFCDTWRIFQTVFAGSTSRLVRVAAIFTALDAYSRPFMTEIGTYGQSLTPAVRPDVLALTTYFGNDIQGFVNSSGFTTGKLFSDSYWQSPLYATHQHLAFTEWKRRILAGDSAAGSGPDATGTSGGFASSLRTLAKETLSYCPQDLNALPCLPLVAYEGGPSIFTDSIDSGGTSDDDGVTIFMEAMNRDPRIADVYRIHLDLAKSKGLWTHTPYTDTSQWSRFGQWGHLELLEQAPADSPKYSLMLEHFSLFSTLRHIDAAIGLVPSFATAATLPTGIAGQNYSTTITTTGGNGSRSVTVVGALLDAGLVISSPTADTLQISGTPITSRKNFIFARVQDADGDPAWRTFTLQTFGGPGTLVQSSFLGTSPALNRPWTQTFVLDSAKVSWGGWQIGSGTSAVAGDDAFVFSVDAPSEADSTLSQAVTDNEFLTATLTPVSALNLGGGEVRFSTRRIQFHSPRQYALFSSVDGFAAPLYTSDPAVTKDNFDETDHVAILPTSAGFTTVGSPLTFRIYAFGAQFSGHQTSLTGFKVTLKNPLTVSALSSNSGPTAGGQSVIITGNDLGGVTSVTFGGTAATITAASVSATALTVVTPAKSASSVNVVVTTAVGSITLTNAYTYVSAPGIGSISPTNGSTAGGQIVIITGTNVANAKKVTFDGLSAAITANTSGTITVITPPHAAGAVNVVVTTAGGSSTSTGGYTYAVVTLTAPTNVSARAVSTFQVNVTWNAVDGATSYEVDRRAPGGGFTLAGTSGSTSFSDTGRAANTAFLYRVRAVNSGGASSNSAVDLATTVIFTDTPLNAGTAVKSVHVTQLRTAVNAVRALAGLGSFTFTDSAASGTTIRAVHLTDLRTALDQGRGLLGFTTGGYTDAAPLGVLIKAVNMQELRNRIE